MCDSFFVFFRMHGRWSPFLTRQRTQREISWYFHIYDWFIDQLGGKGVVKDFTPYQNYLPKGEREREREYFGESWRWITMQTKCLCSHNKLRKIYSALSRREVNLDEHKSRGYEEPIKICASLLSLHVLKGCSILCHIRLAINLLQKYTHDMHYTRLWRAYKFFFSKINPLLQKKVTITKACMLPWSFFSSIINQDKWTINRTEEGLGPPSPPTQNFQKN